MTTRPSRVHSVRNKDMTVVSVTFTRYIIFHLLRVKCGSADLFGGKVWTSMQIASAFYIGTVVGQEYDDCDSRPSLECQPTLLLEVASSKATSRDLKEPGQ